MLHQRKQHLLDPLQSSLRTSVVFFWVTFVIGLITGWGIAQASTAPAGAAIAAVIGVGSVVWCSVVFKRTGGSFVDPTRDEVLKS